ncbi:double-strand break repair protein AddB [Pelagibius litoralis]|uniref:Double-strand break repair protein AddB n=1 Tax=Pelagibius litoralis TaxID=374515 RepID=A0A967C7U9_9PROT|nr:double-strand break repair protein AddB [Pelagibius litoralis]NIA68002.1 double-strand break repair protein AddB [Pelagibius litoralis]
MKPPGPAVFTIPAGQSFVDALAQGLLARFGGQPEGLAEATVLLPTRRAARSLQEAFLRASGGRPLLLPRMLPLGDLDPDELLFEAGAESAGAGDAALPPAISGLQRQLLLAACIQVHSRNLAADSGLTVLNEDQAIRLAAELARLLDQVETEGLDFTALAGLVPEDYAAHWQITLQFLTIVTEQWPAILEGLGAIDPAERRRRLAEQQAAAWRARPPGAPIIAAGSTGSIPATAELLAAIADLPQGAVVLPGLDLDSDAETWAEIQRDVGHPQFGLAQLLNRLALPREAVGLWQVADDGTAVGSSPARARFANLALRPPGGTARWHEALPGSEHDAFCQALDGVARIDCADPGEEALVIALILRRAIEQPGRTAALVTPDRDLARRVAVNLQRWRVSVDDSAGMALAATTPGLFLRLTARMMAEELAPVPLLAALKHPLAACGADPATFRRHLRGLETAVLRGARPAPGLAGLRKALAASKAGDALLPWFDDLADRLGPLAEAMQHREASLADLVEAHMAVAEALAESDAESGAERLWAGEAGEAAALFAAELQEAAAAAPPLRPRRYPAALEALMAGRAVRPRFGLHPRLAILGPLEARLQHADVLVLGGLNEGTWPAEVEAGPWLSRPMQTAFGLPLPERRIGLAAHDFYQGFCARQVYLTRAQRVEGTPSVAARWLRRIDALCDGLELGVDLHREEAALRGWAAALDEPAEVVRIAEPAPRPPLAARPRKLSVTRIETWMRDPYALYAREILKLRPLDPLDADPGAAERGTLVHEALEQFLQAYPGRLPADALDSLLEIGAQTFRPISAKPGAFAFWWPRFVRVAGWFVATELERRADVRQSFVETEGHLILDAPGGEFRLTAKADRIDHLGDGSLVIIDYKTGAPPTAKAVEAGFAPQLPLEAAIALRGGFAALPQVSVSALAFWRLSGGTPAGEVLSAGRTDPRVLAEAALDGLTELVAAFDDPETPYACKPRPELAPRFNDYDHLSRIAEWSVEAEGS